MLAATSLCVARLTTAQSTILLPESELILISDKFKFTEGPAADSNGDVLFTDQPNDQIIKYSFHTGQVSTWLKPAGRSNGLYYASEKSLIACADDQNELWEIDTSSKEHRVVTKNFGDRRFSGPNDCWVDQDGSIYFANPLYCWPYGHKPSMITRRCLPCRQGGQVSQVATIFNSPMASLGIPRKGFFILLTSMRENLDTASVGWNCPKNTFRESGSMADHDRRG